MTADQSEVLVIGDAEGNYYVIPRDAIEQFRVADDYKSEIAQMVSGEEVSGYAHPALNWLGRSLASSAQSWAWASACYMPDAALFGTLYARSDRHERGDRAHYSSEQGATA